jgi:hypothetical protein
MGSLEEKRKNLEHLVEASRRGDAAAVRALLESGNVNANGVSACVRLLTKE